MPVGPSLENEFDSQRECPAALARLVRGGCLQEVSRTPRTGQSLFGRADPRSDTKDSDCQLPTRLPPRPERGIPGARRNARSLAPTPCSRRHDEGNEVQDGQVFRSPANRTTINRFALVMPPFAGEESKFSESDPINWTRFPIYCTPEDTAKKSGHEI